MTVSTPRLVVLAAVFLAVLVIVHGARAEQQVPTRQPLRGFPIHVANWSGQVAPDFDERVVRILGADEYLTRIYWQGAAPPVDLFVGYYGSQRTGSVIHSPLNCLPGAGWQLVDRQRVQMTVGAGGPGEAVDGRRIAINQVLMQKGEDRQVALYWYHERGRVIASEYTSRAFMMLDAARYGRTDGALVRVITPVDINVNATEQAAARLTEFVRTIFPLLDTYLPV